MIIKGLCKRYERWNPVHPTYGAFWGMGIGVGCGVGWGPGFGPEVIGYVGAGCGFGFSVGFTYAGVGIGLPANIVLRVPYNAMVAVRGRMSEFIQSNSALHLGHFGGDDWNDTISPQICGLQKAATESLSKFQCIDAPNKGMIRVDIVKLKSSVVSNTKSALEGMKTSGNRFFGPRKGG